MQNDSLPSNAIYSQIGDIPDSFNGYLLDAYGIFWGGNQFGIIPGAKDAMENLVANNKIVGILSNTTQLAENEIKKLQKNGLLLGTHYHFLITSGEVAKKIFSAEMLPFNTNKKKYYLFCREHPKYSSHLGLFEDSPYKETDRMEDADFIYINIPHIFGEDQTEPGMFLSAVNRLLNTGLPMVCANPDRFAHEGNPPQLVVRQGSIAALYESLGGKVYYIGKPSSIVYETALQKFASYQVAKIEEILMVGDTPETDIRGAKNLGMPSALAIETGIAADRIAQLGLDHFLTNLSEQDKPNFYIHRLGHP